jgi:endonuclease YncB( thermonuclease family)
VEWLRREAGTPVRGLVVFKPQWAFFAEEWIDGDTAHGTVDMGCGHRWTPPKGLRLLMVGGAPYDAPEMRKPEQRDRAQQARVRAKQLAPEGLWYPVVSEKYDPDAFGRVLCSVKLPDGSDLATVLVREGHVKVTGG